MRPASARPIIRSDAICRSRLGTRLGPYEVVAALGAGGMGEVYRARDTKLSATLRSRSCPTRSRRSRRLARFKREAQVLASLNHPNIARSTASRTRRRARACDGAGRGPTLAERIARARCPSTRRSPSRARSPKRSRPRTSRASSIAISSRRTSRFATTAREGAGLRPRQGARSGRRSATGRPAASPTITSPAMTELGVVLGTAGLHGARNRPRAKPSTAAPTSGRLARAVRDAAGRRASRARRSSETIAHVIISAAGLDRAARDAPATVRRCSRAASRRIRSSASGTSAKRVLDADGIDPASPDGSLRSSAFTAAPVAALWPRPSPAGLALALRGDRSACCGASPRRRQSSPCHTLRRARRRTRHRSCSWHGPAVALSPDGSMMAFVASAEGVSPAATSDRSTTSPPRALPGTEGGFQSGLLARRQGDRVLHAPDRLKKTTLDGAVTTVIEAGADGDPRGITWLPDGTLVYALAGRRSAPSACRQREARRARSRHWTRRQASARIAGRSPFLVARPSSSRSGHWAARTTTTPLDDRRRVTLATGHAARGPQGRQLGAVCHAPDISSTCANRACTAVAFDADEPGHSGISGEGPVKASTVTRPRARHIFR